jgi:hypothetical protein
MQRLHSPHAASPGRRKVVGKGRFGVVDDKIFFPESENWFKCDVLGSKLAIFPARWDLGHEANPENPKSTKEPPDFVLRGGSELSSPRLPKRFLSYGWVGLV